MNEIILRASKGKELVLSVNCIRPSHSVEEVLKSRKNVYEDQEYAIVLPESAQLDYISVYVNNERRNCMLSKGEIRFEDERIFENVLGFAQISLNVVCEGKSDWYYTEFMSVLIRPSRKNKSINEMIKFIYENQGDFLFHESLMPELGGDKIKDDFWTQMLIFEDIANVYEDCFGYFMANSRYELKKIETLDRIEKLQYVDSKTIQYMTQHPEYLDRNVVGIAYGAQHYLPRKTLMTQNTISLDIYENQVVIHLLEYMVKAISALKKELINLVDGIHIDETAEGGYLVSSYVIYENAQERINEFRNQIDLLEEKYGKLIRAYRGIMTVSDNEEFMNPRFTAIFANVPQYNRIYNCITSWNKRNVYDFEKERLMMSFFDVFEIFEIYTLTKLILQLQDIDFVLTEAKHVNYPKRRVWRDNSRRINNTFVFKQGSQIITIYYEPVIYNEDYSELNGIFLYRNNTVSLNKESEDELKGSYYVPDYVIKYEDSKIEHYLICDAKYTYKRNVRFKYVPDLAYKYLTSVSVMRENARIKGLYVFYAIADDYTDGESFFDVRIDGIKNNDQEIMMVPYSEEIPYAYQDNNAFEMIRRLIK